MTNKKENNSFYSGTSGLQLLIPKYKFPEAHKDSSRLSYYATFFNSIEINSSFYKIPSSKTIAKWRDMVPPDFRFTFKLFKGITHAKNLLFDPYDISLFFEAIDAVGSKKGCVLLQFPPSVTVNKLKELLSLLQCIKNVSSHDQWTLALEFRDKSWYQTEVYDLLRANKCILVIQDMPKSTTPMIEHWGDYVYVRFHGPNGNYRDSYSESFLHEYAGYIKEWIEDGKKVCGYFNNTMGDAFKNSQTLANYVIQYA